MKLPNSSEKLKNENSILMPFLMSKTMARESSYVPIAKGEQFTKEQMYEHFADNFDRFQEDDEIRDCLQSAHNYLCEELQIQPAEVVLYLDNDIKNDFIPGNYSSKDGLIRFNSAYLGYAHETNEGVGANAYTSIVKLTLDKFKDDIILNYLSDKYSNNMIKVALSNYLIASNCNKIYQQVNQINQNEKESTLDKLCIYCETLNKLSNVKNAKLRRNLQPIINRELKAMMDVDAKQLITDIVRDDERTMMEFDFCFDGVVANKIMESQKAINSNQLAQTLYRSLENVKSLSSVKNQENNR